MKPRAEGCSWNNVTILVGQVFPSDPFSLSLVQMGLLNARQNK